jgi:hypothetical protein
MSTLLRGGLLVCLVALQACTGNATPHASSAPAPTVASPNQGDLQGANPSEQTSSRVTVGSTWLELRGCELAYGVGTGSSTISTELPPPCQFAKEADGSVRVVKSEGVSVLVVESSRSTPPLIAGGTTIDCDTRLRGIVVTAQGVQLSRDTQKVAMCAPAPWDEKMFHVFALHTVAPSQR